MNRAVGLWAGVCVATSMSMKVRPAVVALQTAQPELRIELVDVPRPVSDAVRQIERHFGRVVTYEDVSYVAPGDIVDVTAQVRRDGRMDRRVLGMRGGSLELVHTPTAASVDAQLDEVLAQLLAEWNGPDHSGEFRVERAVGGHHVIPVARKGRDGHLEAYTSPLETRITFPVEERTGLETLAVVAKAVSEAAGRRVIPATMRPNGLSRARVVVGAQGRIARDVLWDALQAIDPALSWQMLCEVGEDATCALNIHAVTPGGPTSV